MFDFSDCAKKRNIVLCVSVYFMLIIVSSGFSQAYDFDNGTLQDWTMKGIYAWTPGTTIEYQNPFSFSWDDETQYPGEADKDPEGDDFGSASVYTSDLTFPPDFDVGSEWWFVDLFSPDITSNQQWQDITGISLNLHSAGFSSGEGFIQILLDVTKSDGNKTTIREEAANQGVYYSFTNEWMTIHADHFINISVYTVNNIRLRIFGYPDIAGSMREVNIDNVTAITGEPGTGLSGYVSAWMCGEGGNALTITYDSYFNLAHELTRARIDFTGTNVYLDDGMSWCCGEPPPEVTERTKITDQIFEIGFSNFTPGKSVCIGQNFDLGSTGSPYGSSYEGATVEMTFTGLSCDIPLTGTFEQTDAFSAKANFSCEEPSSPQPPPSPSNLTTTVVSSTQIDLSWQDNSDNEDGFRIERKTESEAGESQSNTYLEKTAPLRDRSIETNGDWTQIATVPANQTSYSDKGLSPNTTYAYRVQAYNSAGNSSYSDEESKQTEESGTYIIDFDAFPAYIYNTVVYRRNDVLIGCGPTSGAMILGYFEHTYDLPAPNGLLTDPVSGMEEGLATAWALHGNAYMNTRDDGFSSPFDIKPGLEDYAGNRGYEIEVMIHVSPTYDPGGDYSWNDYGSYGEAWINDGDFWHQDAGGDWMIDPDDFCDFAGSMFAQKIPLFLTIDTDMDRGGDHWVPVVGYDRSSGKYAFYDTYRETLQWADIHYAKAAGPVYENSIVMVRSVQYITDDRLPSAPTNLVAHLIPEQVHLTWEDNSDDETGFIIERRMSPAFPSTWYALDTLDANAISYQTDAPAVFSQTLYFRIYAYNEYGSSEYSNADTVRSYLTLSWIKLKNPNGGEEWEPGSVHEIQWESSASMPAYMINRVTIRYSIDGASHWIDPPIAANIDNTGSYLWTVPDTESDQCIVKIEDAYDGSPYDLTNTSFTIGQPVTPVLSVSADTLDFGTSLNELNFCIENEGGGALTWEVSETPEKLWIASVDPVSESGEAIVTVMVDRSLLTGSGDVGVLKITSNGGTEEIIVLIKAEQGSLPEEWTFHETGNNATVILPVDADPNIDGDPLSNGDYVGVFTGSGLCCGYGQWQEANLSLTVWGDDSQTDEVDGFQAGETIYYRVYRLSEAQLWDAVTVTYSQGTGCYQTDAIMILSQFDATELSRISIALAQGWSIFSMNVDPVYANIDSVMHDIKEKVVLAKDGEGNTYVPDFGINNIGDMDFRRGYKAYLTDPADLVVVGHLVDPSTPINLTIGWNLIAYLPDHPVDIAEALASVHDGLVIAKNAEGNTYIPAYNINTIGNMEPGQGYKLYVDSEATLVYPVESSPAIPDLTIKKTVLSGDTDSPQHFQFHTNTGQNCTVVIPSSINPGFWDGTPLESGDEIGVFNSDSLCCGAVVWNNENAAITVWGDDVQTADIIDGFLENDTLRFRILDSSAGEEYQANGYFEEASDCVYHTDGYGILTGLVSEACTGVEETFLSALPEQYQLLQNFPNPFNPLTVIEYHLPQSSDVKLSIYDVKAQLVRRLIVENQPAGCQKVIWSGCNETGEAVAAGLYIYRIEIKGNGETGKRFVDVKKMILMK